MGKAGWEGLDGPRLTLNDARMLLVLCQEGRWWWWQQAAGWAGLDWRWRGWRRAVRLLCLATLTVIISARRPFRVRARHSARREAEELGGEGEGGGGSVPGSLLPVVAHVVS
jgi:hypothetical protein